MAVVRGQAPILFVLTQTGEVVVQGRRRPVRSVDRSRSRLRSISKVSVRVDLRSDVDGLLTAKT